MRNKSYNVMNVLLYILIQISITTAFYYDEYQRYNMFLYLLSDYLFIVFADIIINNSIKSILLINAILNKSRLKTYLNLFLLCFSVVCCMYILFAVPILLSMHTSFFYKILFAFKQNSYPLVIAISFGLTLVSYIIYFYLSEFSNSGIGIIKKSFSSFLRMKDCTVIILFVFVVFRIFTVFIESNVVRFSDSNNFEIYPLSIAIIILARRVRPQNL